MLDNKMVRFYGKVFFRRPQRGLREKLLNDKIFIFWREGVIRQPLPSGGALPKNC